LPSNLYQFKEGTGEARCILDSITSLQNGADLIWIETEKTSYWADWRHDG
jgi:isocitrate lyase